MNKIPTATYRLQFNKEFTFADACEIIDYLNKLNISHLYLSPIFSSSPGSNHGYDVTDFTSISEERGGETGFKKLADTVSAYNYPIKLILDIVPNHMAATTDNPYWLDVLRNGHNSEYWPLFDLRVDENQKIKLPVLSSDTKLSEFKLTDDGIEFGDRIYPLNAISAKKLQQNPSTDIPSLLDMQYYCLVPWQDISSSMSYRRFFDVTGLIGVRVESDDIYQKSHKALFELIEKYPCIEGVRVDHIDGLADPKIYLDRLSKSVSTVWIEKILSRPEEISKPWKTTGTTGYEFIDRINQLFVHPDNLRKIQDHWIEKTQSKWKDFETCVFESKQQVLDELFAPELNRIIELSTDNEDLKYKASLFWNALTISLDIYRFYNEQDLDNSEWLDSALKIARESFGKDFRDAEKIFLPQLLSPKSDAHKKALQEWQQLSGPVMAKGLEDTAHYRFTPLTALNEVGCIPLIEEPTKEEHFKWIQKRADIFPFALNSTSTHDTKRSEDTRQRLYALADNPDLWIDFTARADLLGNIQLSLTNIGLYLMITTTIIYFLFTLTTNYNLTTPNS
ncbi:MAG: hypothetical protein DI586_02940 [Micavibrio aeruginosavorus]|uniref:Glycosyl hydrolase family 13 catalytic domain-containing protein n=1 Tax=Micavibrio aeruginosavorus TaxID=349221 RepID=A0A2W5FQE2_9BACT|nr:MAG: hypothetical protein DI586_02940 [Micavibrio aeruginosavorus]